MHDLLPVREYQEYRHVVSSGSHVSRQRAGFILFGVDTEIGTAAELSDYQFPTALVEVVTWAGSGVARGEGVGFVSLHYYFWNMGGHERFTLSIFR